MSIKLTQDCAVLEHENCLLTIARILQVPKTHRLFDSLQFCGFDQFDFVTNIIRNSKVLRLGDISLMKATPSHLSPRLRRRLQKLHGGLLGAERSFDVAVVQRFMFCQQLLADVIIYLLLSFILIIYFGDLSFYSSDVFLEKI